MLKQGGVTVSEDSQETSPLLTFDDENAGPSAVDGAALSRNDRDGEHCLHNHYLDVLDVDITGDNGETYDNVPKNKRQLG